MFHLEGEELELFLSLFQVNYLLLSMTRLQAGDTALHLNDSVLLTDLLVLLLLDLLLEVFLAVLSLELFTHGKRYSTVVECHIGSIRLFDIITNTKEQKATLGLIECHLTDNFVEALSEQLFTNGAESSLACLSLQKFLVEHLSEASDIDSGGWLVTDLLREVLSLLNPFSRSKDLVQDVLSSQGQWLSATSERCQSGLLHACYKKQATVSKHERRKDIFDTYFRRKCVSFG